MNPAAWDVMLFRTVNDLAGASSALDRVMTAVGSPLTFSLPALVALALWWWTHRREAVIGAPLLVVLFVAVDAMGAQLKHVVQRPRPCQSFEAVHVLGCRSTFGFPSNHTVNTAAAAAFLHVLYPWTGWLTWPVVALIGVARVYTGAHYPSDVLGGWALGSLAGAFAAWALIRWLRAQAPAPVHPTDPPAVSEAAHSPEKDRAPVR